ncbi:MAG: M1 family metallopeptidase [Candidatus Kapabacteria bacterium]|nr:M1 family metallopeptidase [Candidatus Kapabacteria bacterium]
MPITYWPDAGTNPMPTFVGGWICTSATVHHFHAPVRTALDQTDTFFEAILTMTNTTRRLLVLLSVVLMFSGSLLRAQEDKKNFLDWMVTDQGIIEQMRPMHPEATMVDAFPRLPIDTTLDVTRYEIVWDMYSALLTDREKRPARKAEASVRITARSRVDAMAEVVLNSVSLIIDSVVSQGVKLPFTTASNRLTITAPKPLDRGQEITFTVYYAITQDQSWLSIYSRGDVEQNGIPTGSFFTFAQPEGARTWLPCNDVPTDKALMTVRVRVPKDFTVVSNGLPTDSVPDGDTASWQSWAHDQPMPTYLLTINAAVYKYYPQEYRRKDNTVVPILNYHYDVDHQGAQFNAVGALANSSKWFEALESRLGRYPFASYGHVTVTPIQFGGMEHQTMSTINRIWLNGNYENGYVHEVAHHWIGDLVTCATWADIWLNEGGASFCEALYYEYVDGQAGYLNRLDRFRSSYLRVGLTGTPVYNPPPAALFSSALTYAKAGWIYHMIRRNASSEDDFFATWREYFDRYRLGSAQTWEFLEFLKQKLPNPKVPWDVFFDQWLVKSGHPVLNVNLVSSQPGTYNLTIRQTQSGATVPNAFVMSLRVRAKKGAEEIDRVVQVAKPTETVTWDLPFTPDTVIVDPNRDILCEVESTITSVDDSETSSSWLKIVGRQPLAIGNELVVASDAAWRGQLRLVDVAGRTVAGGSIDGGIGVIATDGLSVGRYLLVADDGNRRLSLPVALFNP